MACIASKTQVIDLKLIAPSFYDAYLGIAEFVSVCLLGALVATRLCGILARCDSRKRMNFFSVFPQEMALRLDHNQF